ncbi:MAG: hypothetical protein AAGK05_19695, partial [Pseudomonadota bacterium]
MSQPRVRVRVRVRVRLGLGVGLGRVSVQYEEAAKRPPHIANACEYEFDALICVHGMDKLGFEKKIVQKCQNMALFFQQKKARKCIFRCPKSLEEKITKKALQGRKKKKTL